MNKTISTHRLSVMYARILCDYSGKQGNLSIGEGKSERKRKLSGTDLAGIERPNVSSTSTSTDCFIQSRRFHDHHADTRHHLLRRHGRKLHRWHSQAVSVAEKQHSSSLRALTLLHPLTPSTAVPHAAEKVKEPFGLAFPIVIAHDRFDGRGGFLAVVEGNGGDVVMQDVRIGDAVHDGVREEGDVTVNGRGGTPGKGPRFRSVVREGGIGVLEVGDGH